MEWGRLSLKITGSESRLGVGGEGLGSHREKAQEPELGMKGKLLLVGSSHLWVRIEDWELKGTDMGLEVPSGGQKSHSEVKTQG